MKIQSWQNDIHKIIMILSLLAASKDKIMFPCIFINRIYIIIYINLDGYPFDISDKLSLLLQFAVLIVYNIIKQRPVYKAI